MENEMFPIKNRSRCQRCGKRKPTCFFFVLDNCLLLDDESLFLLAMMIRMNFPQVAIFAGSLFYTIVCFSLRRWSQFAWNYEKSEKIRLCRLIWDKNRTLMRQKTQVQLTSSIDRLRCRWYNQFEMFFRIVSGQGNRQIGNVFDRHFLVYQINVSGCCCGRWSSWCGRLIEV